MNRTQRRAAARSERHARTARSVPHRRALALGSAAVLAAAGASTAVTLSAGVAGANAPIVVDSLADDGSGGTTLREAIDLAETTPGQDTVSFSVTGTITLQSDLPQINEAIHLVGPGSDLLTIDGDGHRVFYFYDVDESEGTLEISDLTITGGGSSWAGGAIMVAYGNAPVVISGIVLSGNSPIGPGGGLATYGQKGTLALTDSQVSGNTASNGGGLYFATGSGRDIAVTVSDCEISGNTASAGGGGISVNSGPVSLVVSSSTVAGNTTDGLGGGIKLESLGSRAIVNSTITANHAGNGGAVFTRHGLGIAQSTITGNTSAGNVGTFYLPTGGISVVQYDSPSPLGPVTSLPAPIYDGNLFISGSIVTGNDPSLGSPLDVASFGTLASSHSVNVDADHSLLGTIGGNAALVDLGGTSTGVDVASLLLGPLGDNGGPTRTIPLGAGSPAIDAGPAAIVTFAGNEWDQRGDPWVRVHGSVVDVGAFENQPDPDPGPGPAPDPTPEPTFTG